MPTLIVHGDDDQIVPIAIGAEVGQDRQGRDAEGLSRGAARHTADPQGEFNADLLAFITEVREPAPAADEAKIDVTLVPALHDRV